MHGIRSGEHRESSYQVEYEAALDAGELWE